MMRLRKNKLLRLLPFVLVLLAAPVFISCDAGSDAGQPTGPDSEYDPSFPVGSLLSLRLSPSTVTVDTTTVEVDVKAQLNSATAAGAPLEGIPVSFQAEGAITVSPSQVLTNANGLASTTAYVPPGMPSGSYTVYARTSFGNSGPSTEDFKVLKVSATPLPPLTITTGSLPGGTVGTAYNATIAASGGTGSGTYSWSSEGTLPSGLTLVSTSFTASLTGTPTTDGTSTFFVTVR
jgi:hypothetical protein